MSDSPPPVAVTIVGAGPAGVSARLWLRTFDVPTRWVAEDGEVGGMLERVHNPLENHVGANFESGPGLEAAITDQVAELDGVAPEATRIERVTRSDEVWQLETAAGESFPSRAVILATGTTYRRLGVPGEREGLGDYVSQSTSRDADRFGGRTVAVVGGGDAGFEGALQLAELGSEVHMLLRNGDYRARPQFVDPVEDHPGIFIHPFPTRVERIEPLPDPRGCRLHVDEAGTARTLEVACLFVRIGVDPVFPATDPPPETDDEGHILVDKHQRTAREHLYAAGDVTPTQPPSVAVATGGGARAAYAAADDLGLA